MTAMFGSFRLVYLDKLRLRTRAKEAEQSLARGGKDPFVVVRNPSASKGGVAETSIKVIALITTVGSLYYEYVWKEAQESVLDIKI